MADALLGVVLQNLKSLVQNELATISGIKSKAQKLSTTLDLINAVLEDAEQKQVINRSIKVWLQQLKDAVMCLMISLMSARSSLLDLLPCHLSNQRTSFFAVRLAKD